MKENRWYIYHISCSYCIKGVRLSGNKSVEQVAKRIQDGDYIRVDGRSRL